MGERRCRVVRPVGLHVAERHPVVRHHGAHSVSLLGGEDHAEHAAHAEPDRAHAVSAHGLVAEEEVDSAAHVARRPIRWQRVHELGRLVHLGVLGQIAVVQVGSESRETLACELVAHALDVGVEPPPLLQDDHTRPRSLWSARQIAACGVAVARELDVLTHGRLSYPTIFPWSHETTSSKSTRTATRLATMKLMYSSPWSGPNPVS